MNKKDYTNIVHRKGSDPSWCYRSNLTVYEERFLNNSLISGGWNCAGYPLDVLSNCPSSINNDLICDPAVFHIELDGVCVDYLLEVSDFKMVENANNSKEAIIILKSNIKPVEITVHTLIDGTPVLSRWLEIRNTSDKSMALSRLSVMSGALTQKGSVRNEYPQVNGDDLYEIGYFECDKTCNEGDLVWRSLPKNKTSISGRFSRDRHRHPVIFIKNKLSGETFVAQLGWSAGYEFSIENYAGDNPQSLPTLMFEIAVTGFSPLRIIEPGEVFTSPMVHIGSLIGTTDDAVNAMNDHIRKSVLNLTEASPDACLVGSGMGAEHDMSVETTKNYIDQMALCGAEVFIVDAGWYCPPGLEMKKWHSLNGNWHPDTERYPNGIEEIREYAHKKGLKFGMWMEPERIGKFASLYEERRDWFVKLPFAKNNGEFLDFTNPDVVEYIENEIIRVISEYKLDLFRIDYNINSLHYFSMNNPHQFEGGAIRHYEAVYAMYLRLKKKFPDVIFENCASGGARTDLGMMKPFNHTWVSDCQIPPRSLFITNGMTHAIPPERMDRLVAGMGCHEYASLDFHMRNAMFGHMTLNVFSNASEDLNDNVIKFIQHSVKIYKDFIRPFLPTSRIYHHTKDTPSAKKDGKCIIELSSQSRDRGVIGVFTLPGYVTGCVTVFPRGINLSENYEITFDNTGDTVIMNGKEIMTSGIRTLPLPAMTSELILIKQC